MGEFIGSHLAWRMGGKSCFPDNRHDPFFDADSILKGLLITSSPASLSKNFFEKKGGNVCFSPKRTFKLPGNHVSDRPLTAKSGRLLHDNGHPVCVAAAVIYNTQDLVDFRRDRG